MAKSRFALKERRKPEDDMEQLADIMKRLFKTEITECTQNGNVFPWYFTVNARSGDYIDLRGHIRDCMNALKVDIPHYPSRRY